MVSKKTFLAALACLTPRFSSGSLYPDTPSNGSNADELLDRAIEALGGLDSLQSLTGITYRIPNIYLTRSIAESYTVGNADTYVSISGRQNISYSFQTSNVQSRIDRSFVYGEFWYLLVPAVTEQTSSLVVREGDEGYACWVNGNSNVFLPFNVTAGYADAGLTEYLVNEAAMLSPRLLLNMRDHGSNIRSTVALRSGTEMPALRNDALGISVIFNETDSLPYLIRTVEYHPVFSRVTNDWQLSDYNEISGIQFPRHVQNIHNETSILAEYIVEAVDINPEFPADFFNGTAPGVANNQPQAAAQLQNYTRAEIGESYQNGIWGGPYQLTIDNVTATVPFDDIPNLHRIALDGTFYAQLVVEFEAGVLVTDAPPHQAQVIIQWVRENIGKPITYIWPSHHHHDHAAGVREYVEVGATVLVPEIAADYWSHIPSIRIQTFDDSEPFVLSDSQTQAHFVWSPNPIHSDDWTYAMITSACPTSRSNITAFTADGWLPGPNESRFGIADSRKMIELFRQNGLSRDAIVLPAHAALHPLQELIDFVDYSYPELTTTDWMGGIHLNRSGECES